MKHSKLVQFLENRFIIVRLKFYPSMSSLKWFLQQFLSSWKFSALLDLRLDWPSGSVSYFRMREGWQFFPHFPKSVVDPRSLKYLERFLEYLLEYLHTKEISYLDDFSFLIQSKGGRNSYHRSHNLWMKKIVQRNRALTCIYLYKTSQ